MRTLIKVAATLGLLGLTSATFAGGFDFANEADTNGERAIELVAGDNVFDAGDAYVTVTSSDNAYLDFGDAGLGVCSAGVGINSNNGVLLPDQCLVASDDNVTVGESLTLSFSSDASGLDPKAITITDMLFKDKRHNPITDVTHYVWISVDGGNPFKYFFTDAWAALTGSSFQLSYGLGEFYLSAFTSTDVPEPATIALLGLGLLGAGAARRRRVAKN